MFKHILVPVDFTEKGLPAVRMASEMSRQNSARLTLLHVIEEIELSSDEARRFYHKLEESGKARMAALVASLALEGVTPEQKLVYGNRVQMIVQSAEEMEADLIILSSHRIDPENGQGWGTISYRVALLSSCPVLLVK